MENTIDLTKVKALIKENNEILERIKKVSKLLEASIKREEVRQRALNRGTK